MNLAPNLSDKRLALILEACKLCRRDEERRLRYLSVFNTSVIGITFFTSDGVMADINAKACDLLGIRREDILSAPPKLGDLLALNDLALEETQGRLFRRELTWSLTLNAQGHLQRIPREESLVLEICMMKPRDEEGSAIGTFVSCRDVTFTADFEKRHALATSEEAETRSYLTQLTTRIDGILAKDNVRLARYLERTHTLSIYDRIGHIQHDLTQTRCMTLVDERWQKKAMRAIVAMDSHTENEIEGDFRTIIRVKGHRMLHLHFRLMPMRGKSGLVDEYLGICQDISLQKDIELELAKATIKVQEVENAKKSFIKNMIQEIRQPLDIVVNEVGRLDAQHSTDDDAQACREILQQSDHLLHLIENILYLSRLEAHMVEINKQPCNFSQLFSACCQTGWDKYKKDTVHYTIENPYEMLEVTIDPKLLGNVVERVATNAAQNTDKGSIRARYDYIGRKLIITIEDTGRGIDAETLKLINGQKGDLLRTGLGLGLPICQELMDQMGGDIEVNSEQGFGTTVWITLPCHASAIKRKRLI